MLTTHIVTAMMSQIIPGIPNAKSITKKFAMVEK